ncbi:MAG: hypothetical protein E4H43_02710 [Bacteroidia bacterium]|nr:MAG: hypothetical protein E4H43_02710 [Bacteroidia bacterium]
MDQDSVAYDSLAVRPLPKWLTDQRDGLNSIQPAKMEMKEDRSLTVSFALTGAIILLVITILTVYLLRKKKKN